MPHPGTETRDKGGGTLRSSRARIMAILCTSACLPVAGLKVWPKASAEKVRGATKAARRGAEAMVCRGGRVQNSTTKGTLHNWLPLVAARIAEYFPLKLFG